VIQVRVEFFPSARHLSAKLLRLHVALLSGFRRVISSLRILRISRAASSRTKKMRLAEAR
jgi:hypothetical protein